MSKINKALAIIAGLAFFLPFITLSMSVNNPFAGNVKVGFSLSVSGAKAVQCYLSPCSAKDLLGSQPGVLGALAAHIPDSAVNETFKLSGAGAADLGINFLLYAAIAVVVAAIALFFGRGGELLSGVASVGVIVLLFMFRSKFGDVISPFLNSPEVKAAGGFGQIQFAYGLGFWVSAIAAACSAILAFKGSPAVQSAVSAGGGVSGFAPQPPAGTSPGGAGSFCTSCGASNTSGNKFCLSCGATLAAPAPPLQPAEPSAVKTTSSEPEQPAAPAAVPSAQQGNPCPSCRAPNPAGNKFCLSCGGSLMSSVQLFQPQETTLSAPPPAVAAAAPVVPDQQADDTERLNAPATMAAAAAASPSAQPLPLTAPAKEVEQPPAATAVSPSAPQALPAQPSLDLQTSSPEPLQQSEQSACASCGSLITSGQKFCLSCGTPVGQAAKYAEPPVQTQPPVDVAAPVQPEQVCSTCSAPLTEEQKFCLACGTPVSQSAASTQPPAQTAAPTPAHYQATAAPQIFEAQPKSSAKAIVVVIIAVAILGVGGWYGWQYFSRPDVTVSAFPQKTHVAIGGKTSLQASVSGSKDTDVDWTIQEGSKGGQLTVLGSGIVSGQPSSTAIYNAPQSSGTFHVIAASHANPGRSAKIEIVVAGSFQPDTGAAANQAPTTPPTPAASTPSVASPMATQIVGTWRGPSVGTQTVIGADSTIAMTSETDSSKNLSGTYRFTDNSHLQIDFGNGDVRKWEIVGVDNSYLRVTSQSKDGSSAIIFAKIQ